MSEFSIATKTWLKAETYKALHRFATENHTTVDVVLARIADRAVEASQRKPKRTWRRMTPDLIEQAAELHRLGIPWREISERLGVSSSSLANHRAQIIRAEGAA